MVIPVVVKRFRMNPLEDVRYDIYKCIKKRQSEGSLLQPLSKITGCVF
jgi:hypothetical protein